MLYLKNWIDTVQWHLEDIIREATSADPGLIDSGLSDLMAALARDPAADSYLTPFLYYKGYHALQWHRISHWLWHHGQRDIARFLQNRMSEVFTVDIHPAVPMGRGVFIDHATGVVIGETATIGNDVSILQNVTLGGTGKESGDRHPKIGDGVLLGGGIRLHRTDADGERHDVRHHLGVSGFATHAVVDQDRKSVV